MSGIFARDIFSDESLGQASYQDEFKVPAPTIAPVSALPASIKSIAPALTSVLRQPAAAPATPPGSLPPPDFQPQDFSTPGDTTTTTTDTTTPTPFMERKLGPLPMWAALGGGALLVGVAGFFVVKKMRHKTTPNRRRNRRHR